MSAPTKLRTIESEREVDELFEKPLAIIYKHSTSCSVSVVARLEMESFAAAHPEHEVFRVDVIESRSASDYIASRSGLRHESPQLLVLRRGELAFDASHFGVTAKALVAGLG